MEQLAARIERAEQRGDGDRVRVARAGDELGHLLLVRPLDHGCEAIRSITSP
jgi:hypothetical protein